MTAQVAAIVFDCQDPEAQAGFWCAVLDYAIVRRWRDAHDVEYIEIGGVGESRLLFYPVPDHKQAKNRVHLDVRPAGAQDNEVARLVALGARVVDDAPEQEWVVLQDPEGNEFCVLSPRPS